MTRKTFSVCTCICTLLYVSTAFVYSQTGQAEALTLSVDEAVKYALDNSRTLKSSAIDLEIKKRAKNTAWNVFVPTASVSGTMSRDNNAENSNLDTMNSILSSMGGNPIDTTYGSETDRWKAIGNVSVQLPLSLAMGDGIRAVKQQYEAGEITWEQSLKQTELNIRKMFYALLLQQENVKLQKELLENARSRYEQARINYQNGRVPELSVLQAQVTYENKKPSILDLEQSFSQQLDTFVFLLGLPFGTKVELAGSIEPEFIIVSAPDLVQKHIQTRLDIKTLKKNIELMQTSLRASKLQTFTPAFVLGWSFQPIVLDIGKDWLSDSNLSKTNSLTATLSFDIAKMLPFSSNMQSIKDTKQNIEKLNLSLSDALQNAEIEIHKLVDTLNLYQSKITADQGNIDLAQKAYNMTLSAYRNGTTELLDVRDAENSLNQAKLGMINDKYTYLSTLLDLEYAINAKLR